MAAQKAAQKAVTGKKGSKLASLKSTIFGAANSAKKKAESATVAKPANKPAAKPVVKAPAATAAKKDMKATEKVSVPHKKAAAVPAPKAAPGKKGAAVPAAAAASGKTASQKTAAGAGKAAAAPAAGKAAAAPAAGPALTKPAKKGRGKQAQEIAPRERMAGPSIRISYDANGDAVCREVACEGLATSVGYCRLHYIKNWKKIKRKDVILKEGKLNQYIEELVNKYPDKYIEAIREDLANDKDFAKVIYDLDLDESVDDFEGEGESLDGIVGDIKRDFDSDEDGGF
jgi:hypothetical protein